MGGLTHQENYDQLFRPSILYVLPRLRWNADAEGGENVSSLMTPIRHREGVVGRGAFDHMGSKL